MLVDEAGQGLDGQGEELGLEHLAADVGVEADQFDGRRGGGPGEEDLR